MDKFLTILLPSLEHFHLLGSWVTFFAALLTIPRNTKSGSYLTLETNICL